MLIAITGGMGSGKTLLGEILADKARVYDADVITRSLQEPCGAAYAPMREAFGGEFFTPVLDRKKLAAAVFADAKLLEKLNGIVHPLVMAEIEKLRPADSEPVFVQVPLLFESGFAQSFDAVWLVTAGEETRKKRAAARGPRLSDGEIGARLSAQLSDPQRIEAYNKSAPFLKCPEHCRIFENDGAAGEFRTEVEAAFNELFR